jgi:hypothetical protein
VIVELGGGKRLFVSDLEVVAVEEFAGPAATGEPALYSAPQRWQR